MYFNGFALQDEAHFFSDFLQESPYVMSGFSYGAIKAFKATCETEKRVDKLQLFSPAFFQNRGAKFKRLQMIGYKKASERYIETFSANCFLPYATEPLTYAEHSAEALEELLNYVWKAEELQALVAKGTSIEVYLGEYDKISDVEAAYAFFLPYATVTLLKKANHFLQGETYE